MAFKHDGKLIRHRNASQKQWTEELESWPFDNSLQITLTHEDRNIDYILYMNILIKGKSYICSSVIVLSKFLQTSHEEQPNHYWIIMCKQYCPYMQSVLFLDQENFIHFPTSKLDRHAVFWNHFSLVPCTLYRARYITAVGETPNNSEPCHEHNRKAVPSNIWKV